jgi:uncharacterized protein (TIGR01777 family)
MEAIGVTGGTGLIGKSLVPHLLKRGYKVLIFTRKNNQINLNSNPQYVFWDPFKLKCDSKALHSLNAVIHLAGAGLADKRWSEKRKKEIVDSRVQSTQFLLAQLKLHAPGCVSFIGASAIGYYGPDKNSKPFDENMPAYNDFIANVCRQWEASELQAESFLRTVILRFGIVLSKQSGAYQKLRQPMSFGIVPILGSGKQIVSWIHIDDLCSIILFALQNKQISGTYNAVAPVPVTHVQLMQTIAREKGGLKIPVPVPSYVLKLLLGEMSSEVLKSTSVSADKILKAGFVFNYSTIQPAVHALETQ